MNQNSSINLIVAVCTYHRPLSLLILLNALVKQNFNHNPTPHIELLIVDNGCDHETRRLCEIFKSEHISLPLQYIEEPHTGISYARNTALEHIPENCDFLALIDDDEVPNPFWLDELLAQQRETDAAIVRGPVIAEYEPGTPSWVVRGHYFGWPHNRHHFNNGQILDSGSTNNALLKWSVVRSTKVRFDTELAHTGGEDTVYFNHLLHKHNLNIVFAARAGVTEMIPRERTTLLALLSLHYRLGANRLLKKARQISPKNSRLLIIMTHVWKGIYHIISGILGLLTCWLPKGGGRDSAIYSLLRLARGVGHLTGLFGLRYRYYGKQSQ